MLPNVWGYLLGLRAWCGSSWAAESAAYVPWILDGTSLAERERFLAAFPPHPADQPAVVGGALSAAASVGNGGVDMTGATYVEMSHGPAQTAVKKRRPVGLESQVHTRELDRNSIWGIRRQVS